MIPKRAKPMSKIPKLINRTLFELWLGILAFGLFCQLAVFFMPNPGIYSISLWIGVLAAVLASFHMWWSFDRAFDMDEKAATKNVRLHYLLRYLFLIAVLAASGIFFGNYVLATFAGILGMKIGAYLQKPAKKISTLIYGVEILPPLIKESEEDQNAELPVDAVTGSEIEIRKTAEVQK